jgi:hypothetical protein
VRQYTFLALCMSWLTALPASAGTSVIDDSGTLPHDPALAMRWQQNVPRGTAASQMVGTLQLLVRLDVAQWLRRRGRIFLVLPAQQPGPMTVSWTTQGRLLPGHVVSGSRTLLFAGPITTPFIEDVVQLTVTVDGRRLIQSYPVSFRFEIEEG